MRRRLITSTLTVVVVVVLVFGLPLALVERHAIETGAQNAVRAEANRLLTTVDDRLINQEPVNSSTMRRQVSARRYAVITLHDKTVVRIGHRPTGHDPLRAEVTGTRGESVLVEQSRTEPDRDEQQAYALIGSVALFAVLLAAGLALWQARRLASPIADLAETAERLGSGDPRPRLRRYGVPELDRVADVLDASAARIARMLTAERRLAADASHQLRTPLTALSMRLEEIIETPSEDTVREEATIALGQVERLTDVVQRLLTNSRDPRGSAADGSAVAFALDEVLDQQVEEWRPTCRRAGRPLVRAGEPGLLAAGTPGVVAQVLATLIENALMHGEGAVTVLTRSTASSVIVEVSDQGAGIPPELGSRVFERAVSGRNSTGIGLAVARDLAEADGGRLELLHQRPPIFALFLQRASAPSGARPAGRD